MGAKGSEMRTPDVQPTLAGGLITLRPLRADDWDALFAVASDPLLWEQHPERERYREEVFREFFRVALETRSAFAVLENASGAIIGSSRYHGYDADTSEIEIGWSFLARRCWGGTYNGEMKQLMLDHAFQFVDQVVFLIGAQNIRSRRAVERLGAVLLEAHPSSGPETVVYGLRKSRDRQAST
jgi:N-acetyltransferase